MLPNITKKNGNNLLTLAFIAKNNFFSHFCQFRSTLDGCLHCYNKKIYKVQLKKSRILRLILFLQKKSYSKKLMWGGVSPSPNVE